MFSFSCVNCFVIYQEGKETTLHKWSPKVRGGKNLPSTYTSESYPESPRTAVWSEIQWF